MTAPTFEVSKINSRIPMATLSGLGRREGWREGEGMEGEREAKGGREERRERDTAGRSEEEGSCEWGSVFHRHVVQLAQLIVVTFSLCLWW